MPTTPMRFPVAADIFRQHRERVCKDREYGPESIADNPAVGIRYDTYVTKKRIVSFINFVNKLLSDRKLYNELCGIFGDPNFDKVCKDEDGMKVNELFYDARPGLLDEVCSYFELKFPTWSIFMGSVSKDYTKKINDFLQKIDGCPKYVKDFYMALDSLFYYMRPVIRAKAYRYLG